MKNLKQLRTTSLKPKETKICRLSLFRICHLCLTVRMRRGMHRGAPLSFLIPWSAIPLDSSTILLVVCCHFPIELLPSPEFASSGGNLQKIVNAHRKIKRKQVMNSMQTCNSVTFYFMKNSFSEVSRK